MLKHVVFNYIRACTLLSFITPQQTGGLPLRNTPEYQTEDPDTATDNNLYFGQTKAQKYDRFGRSNDTIPFSLRNTLEYESKDPETEASKHFYFGRTYAPKFERYVRSKNTFKNHTEDPDAARNNHFYFSRTNASKFARHGTPKDTGRKNQDQQEGTGFGKFVGNEYNTTTVQFGEGTAGQSGDEGLKRMVTPKDYNKYYPGNDLSSVCYDKTTVYNRPRIFKWLRTQVTVNHRAFHYNEFDFRTYFIELRKSLFVQGRSEECHTRKMNTSQKFLDCSLLRHQRMEYLIPFYPLHQIYFHKYTQHFDSHIYH